MTALLTIILPYFNEQGWIGPTIDSLVAQRDRRFRLLLVDNGSTDEGPQEARRHAAPLGDAVSHIVCDRPGKIHALAAGLAAVTTPLVATCDADTHYPPDYVAWILSLFESNGRAAAVMAIGLYAPAASAEGQRRVARIMRKSRRFPTRCHAGGYAQAFRTQALRAAGGFDVQRWPYVLEDHEIVHPLMRHGTAVYHPDHVCFPSQRRASRASVSWTPMERLLYRRLPDGWMDWYFYRFLAGRLAARNSFGIALREKDWSSQAR
ncbi:glycosyltransferase family 2 protein [Sphingobium aquiterrae]|uniref:glycosyltransferase family 2 protein n=1 Tax=Sphingobium aquiterrae TaxID=2038656 RepID=UPI00301A8F33